jgi:hypothetical protein
MTLNHKVVEVGLLRCIGCEVSAGFNTTITVGDAYFNGSVMREHRGVGDVPAMEGLAGVFWNLTSREINLLNACQKEYCRLPLAYKLGEAFDPYSIDYSEEKYGKETTYVHEVGVRICSMPRLIRIPDEVPIIVSRSLLLKLAGRPNTYITDVRRIIGNVGTEYLLKPE